MNTIDKSEIGNHVRLYLYRLPMKNHEAMLQLSNQFVDMFRNYCIYARSLQLESTDASEGINNIADVMSVNQDEEVWLDLEFTRDRKYSDEVDTKIQKNEIARVLMKKFLGLLAQGSRPIKSDFLCSTG